MKKNKMMRIASVLLVAVLLSTCAISGTFAKYVTEVSSSDMARVAKWGFDTASISIVNLFADSYTNVVGADDDGRAVIAPGTSGIATFMFEADQNKKPEVAYTFSVAATGDCDDLIEKSNIKWALVVGSSAPDAASDEWGTWEAMINEINGLTGDGSYGVGELPDMINKTYAICWMWAFDGDGNAEAESDENGITSVNDSYLGNAAVGGDLKVDLTITITATQVNPAPAQNNEPAGDDAQG